MVEAPLEKVIEFALRRRPTDSYVAGLGGFWSDPRRRHCPIHGETWNHRQGIDGFVCRWCESEVRSYFTPAKTLDAVSPADLKSVLREIGRTSDMQGGGVFVEGFDDDPRTFGVELLDRLPVRTEEVRR